ncbi:MAG: tetratricopeptide repeat protein [Alphaproteobacteria bacterium]|nr:tetratricopeptide repeat protein [Alphaproteobacteria bacterium]
MVDQGDRRLGDLFGKLKEAARSEDARLIEQAIWAVWLESGSATVDLLMQRGLQAMSSGDYPTGLVLFNSIVEFAPNYAEGWNKRATLYYLMGEFSASIADVERTLALEPRHFGALSGLGLIHTQLGDEAKALDAYERALAVHPHITLARNEVERLRKKVRGERI